MMSTNIEKNSAVSEEGNVLTAYGFYLVASLASMQIKSFGNPFCKINSGLTLKIYIDPSVWPAGSAVRIKIKRPKGKIVFKKRDKQKKTGTKKQKTASPGVETGLSARASNSLTTALQRHTWFEKVNFVKWKQFFSAIDNVWSWWWSYIYHEFKHTLGEN